MEHNVGTELNGRTRGRSWEFERSWHFARVRQTRGWRARVIRRLPWQRVHLYGAAVPQLTPAEVKNKQAAHYRVEWNGRKAPLSSLISLLLRLTLAERVQMLFAKWKQSVIGCMKMRLGIRAGWRIVLLCKLIICESFLVP